MKLKYLLLIAISGAIVTIDQATKMYVHTHFRLGESITIIENYFNFTYVRNMGAAFGFLAESHPTFREAFFLSIPPIAMIIILRALKDVANENRYETLALSLIFGGAIGNYIDRLRFRYVIDFLDFHLADHYTWPAFNVADSAIVVGIGMLVLTILKKPKTTEAPTGA